MPLNHNSVTFIAFDLCMYYTLLCKNGYTIRLGGVSLEKEKG